MAIARMLVRSGLLMLVRTSAAAAAKIFAVLCGHLLSRIPGLGDRNPSEHALDLHPDLGVSRHHRDLSSLVAVNARYQAPAETTRDGNPSIARVLLSRRQASPFAVKRSFT